MRKIQSPRDGAVETFVTCISKVDDAALRTRLQELVPIIGASDTDFVNRKALDTVHQMPSTKTLNGNVSADEMVKVYSYRMVNKKQPGRPIYDRIKALAPAQICPFCSIGVVFTLDHFMPKTLFPALVVSPNNLVPSCRDCNAVKRVKTPMDANEVFLHPYFDNVDTAQWLFAEVKAPLAAVFFVKTPQNWSPVLARRLRYHFKELELSEKFAICAATELGDLKGSLSEASITGGEVAVRQRLQDALTGIQMNNVNSWRLAMYQALLASDWYVSGGFRS